MNSENKKSDAEDILSEFQKTHGDEPVEEPQAKAEPVEEPQAKAEPVEEPQAKAEPVEEPQAEAEPVEEPQAKAEPVEEPQAKAEPVEEPQAKAEPVEEPQAKAEPVEEPQAKAEPQVESEPAHQTHNMIFIGTKPIMSYVTATLTQLASLPIVTIAGRGKRITQAIDVSQMIVKRMNEVGYEIGDVRISSDSLVSKDGKKRSVSKIEIDLKNSSGH